MCVCVLVCSPDNRQQRMANEITAERQPRGPRGSGESFGGPRKAGKLASLGSDVFAGPGLAVRGS